MRKLLPLVLVLPLWGCNCRGDDTTTTKVRISPVLPSVPNTPALSTSPGGHRAIRRGTLREPMEEIFKVTDEMSRRAQGRISMKAPAVLMLKLLTKLPSKSYPATFRTFLDDVKDRAKILKDSENLREDFNSLVDSCLACHRVYSLRSIPPVRKLRVSLKDDAGPAKRRRGKRR